MNFKKIVVLSILFAFAILVLQSCGSPKKQHSDKELLIQAIMEGNKGSVEMLLQKVPLGVDRRNLILQYFLMQEDKTLPLIQSLMATNQMVEDEPPQYKEFLNMHKAINSWAFLHEIYRLEVAKDIRILQREQLFLAPSNVDFEKCQLKTSANCAYNSRKQLYRFYNQQQIIDELRNMAQNDPCINLTQSLQDETKANRCLKKRMGELQVVLKQKPQFTYQQWSDLLK